MRVWDVGIVGGGPGGLMTAYALEAIADSPVRITLYEASRRVGGKILTPQFSTAPVRYEAGAAEFYDYSHFDTDALKELIEDLGLPMSPMGGSAVIMNDRILSNLEDVRDQLGPEACESLKAFDRNSKDAMLPEEFYYSDHPDGVTHPPVRERFQEIMQQIDNDRTRSFVETLIHSDLATEAPRTSPVYGLQNYLMNDPAYMSLYGIVGGNERLPQELASRINADIRLEHQVVSVARREGTDRLCVTSTHAGEVQQQDFDFVVIALPHNHIKSVAFEGGRLPGAVQRHWGEYNFPAHYLRVTILFETPFWRSSLADSYWMLDRFGGCCLYDESSRNPGGTHGVLGWLLAGAAAEEKSQLSDDELIAEALASLPEFMAHGRSQFLEARVHRWVGAVNALPGGLAPKPLDQRHRPEPIDHPHLYFVGDYMYDSTLNGVVDAAEYVADWIGAHMAEQASSSLGAVSPPVDAMPTITSAVALPSVVAPATLPVDVPAAAAVATSVVTMASHSPFVSSSSDFQ
ncbi:MAG: FAD-dependent oxidoreductase [Planctomycetaceae bacterium]